MTSALLLTLLTACTLQSPAADGGWAIAPGHERVFAKVTAAAAGELPAGWARRAVAVPRDRVIALYGPADSPAPTTCESAPICLQLVHPSTAGPDATVAGPFAIVSARAGEGDVDVGPLVSGVAARIVKRRLADPFKALAVKLPEARPAPGARQISAEDAGADDVQARFGRMLDSDAGLKARLLRVEVTPARVRYVLRADSGPAEDGGPPVALVELRDRSPRMSDPREVTRSFFVQAVGGVSDPPDLAARVHAALGAGDDGTLRLQPDDVMATGERPSLHTLLISLTLAALLGLLLALPWLLREAAREGRGERVAWGILLAGVVLRFVLPTRLVEMGIGYQLARYADELILPRYGAGTTTLHHVIFQVFGADHDVMITTHRVIGALTLPLAFAAGLAWARAADVRSRWFAAAWASASAPTPILAKSDTTESNLVPVLFGLFAALLAWERGKGVAAALVTLAGLGLVALSRPEMAVIGPGIWLALTRPWRRWRMASVVLLPLAAAVAVQLVFVQHVVEWEAGVQSLHLGKTITGERVLQVLANNALFDPTLVPALLAPLALGALAIRSARLTTLTLLLGGLAWVYVYAVDLSAASQPRLHVVVVLAWSWPAAVALAALAERRQAFGVGCAVAWAVASLATIPTLWAPTNEDTQEELYGRLAETLDGTSGWVMGTLSRSDAPDPAGHYTHRHLPIYRFGAGTVSTLGDLDRWVGGDAPVYYFQGTSCWARLLRSQTDESGPLAPCEAVARTYTLEPVWTEVVPNHGNPRHMELGYYPDVEADPTFEVGLWRVTGHR